MQDYNIKNSNQGSNEFLKKYDIEKNTVSHIRYHFVFCPRYRRKIFHIDGVESRFKEAVKEECEKQKIRIYKLECHEEYVYMYVGVLPSMDISVIMKQVKGAASNVLRSEFIQLRAMTSIWTRNYFVSTDTDVDMAAIKWFVDSQKKRPD